MTQVERKQKARKIAYNVRRYVEQAVGEMGYQIVEEGKAWDPRVEAARKDFTSMRSSRDVAGSLSDWLFNDPTTVNDLAGDRLYDVMRNYGLSVDSQEDWEACVNELGSVMRHITFDLRFVA